MRLLLRNISLSVLHRAVLCILLLVGDGYVEEGGGYEARCVGAGKGARSIGHCVHNAVMAQNPVYFGSKQTRRKGILLDNYASPGSGACVSIFGLMVFSRGRQWNKNRRQSPRRYFKNGRTRARYDKARGSRRHARGKVIKVAGRVIPRKVRVVPHDKLGSV